MNDPTRVALLATSLLFSALAVGQEAPCSAYMMDVENERHLFMESPAPVDAAAQAEAAPVIEPGTLYAVKLRTQDKVRYLALPSRKPEATRPGGMLRLAIAETGRYRLSVDANFWIDVVFEGKALEALDFRSDRECTGPRKIVTFNLPAGAELVVQLIDAGVQSVRLAVTPVPPEIW